MHWWNLVFEVTLHRSVNVYKSVVLCAGIGCPVPRIPAESSPLADHVSATRILCGALVFPTIATIVGKLMFSSVNSNLQRTILVWRNFRKCLKCISVIILIILLFFSQGGIAFVAIKGAFKVYFKQQQYLRQAHRKILNFPEVEDVWGQCQSCARLHPAQRDTTRHIWFFFPENVTWVSILSISSVDIWIGESCATHFMRFLRKRLRRIKQFFL